MGYALFAEMQFLIVLFVSHLFQGPFAPLAIKVSTPIAMECVLSVELENRTAKIAPHSLKEICFALIAPIHIIYRTHSLELALLAVTVFPTALFAQKTPVSHKTSAATNATIIPMHQWLKPNVFLVQIFLTA